jgi:hypothetical protein
VNAVILSVLSGAAVLLAALLFLTGLLVGRYGLATVSPAILLYVWDGLVVAFLFCWAIGLLAELQRSEVFSLHKILHLPVSPSGAFLINYLSSLMSFNLIVFVPAMVGLGLGLAWGRGPRLLLVLPLLAAFLLMVTAVTYQFQGWLAALMINPRRRRTIIVVLTAAVLLLSQTPNLLNVFVFQPWSKSHHEDRSDELTRERVELDRALAAKEITEAEYQRRLAELEREHQAHAEKVTLERVEQSARVINAIVPFGWLPLGAFTSAEGNPLPAFLGFLGLAGIGTASLWRAYHTTLRIYTGQVSKRSHPRRVAKPAAPRALPLSNALERDLSWVPEQATVVALASFRSLWRAPETKMLLLTPLFLVVIFGSVFLTRSSDPPEGGRFLMPLGGMVMLLLSMIQLLGNQFGFDRNGFRVFVLCPAARRDILLGKNLAVLPLVLALGGLLAVALEVIYPMRADHFVAVFFLYISMFLLCCLMANWLSILAPLRIAPGSLKPTQTKGMAILMHLGFVCAYPLVLGPTLLPLGIEVLLETLGWPRGLPICLVLSVLQCGLVGYVYYLLLGLQGDLLQEREKKIVDVVTSRAE